MNHNVGPAVRMVAVRVAEALGVGALLPLVAVEVGAATHMPIPIEAAFAGTGIPNLPVTDSCSPGPGLDVVNKSKTLVHVQFANQRTHQTSQLILGPGDPGHYPASVGDTITTTISEDATVSDTETVDSCSSPTTTSSSSTTSTIKVTPSSSTTTTNSTPATTVTIAPVTTTRPPVASSTTSTTATANQGGNTGIITINNADTIGSTTTSTLQESGFTATPGTDGTGTAAGQAEHGRTIVRTGSDALRNIEVGSMVTVAGLLTLGMALRRKEDQQPAE